MSMPLPHPFPLPSTPLESLPPPLTIPTDNNGPWYPPVPSLAALPVDRSKTEPKPAYYKLQFGDDDTGFSYYVRTLGVIIGRKCERSQDVPPPAITSPSVPPIPPLDDDFKPLFGFGSLPLSPRLEYGSSVLETPPIADFTSLSLLGMGGLDEKAGKDNGVDLDVEKEQLLDREQVDTPEAQSEMDVDGGSRLAEAGNGMRVEDSSIISGQPSDTQLSAKDMETPPVNGPATATINDTDSGDLQPPPIEQVEIKHELIDLDNQSPPPPPPPPPKSSAPVDHVDVDLGPLKSVSRNHARISYRAEIGTFCLDIYGRNGAWVDDRYYVRGSTVPLNQGSQIQIATRIFSFILPPSGSPSPTYTHYALDASPQNTSNPLEDIPWPYNLPPGDVHYAEFYGEPGPPGPSTVPGQIPAPFNAFAAPEGWGLGIEGVGQWLDDWDSEDGSQGSWASSLDDEEESEGLGEDVDGEEEIDEESGESEKEDEAVESEQSEDVPLVKKGKKGAGVGKKNGKVDKRKESQPVQSEYPVPAKPGGGGKGALKQPGKGMKATAGAKGKKGESVPEPMEVDESPPEPEPTPKGKGKKTKAVKAETDAPAEKPAPPPKKESKKKTKAEPPSQPPEVVPPAPPSPQIPTLAAVLEASLPPPPPVPVPPPVPATTAVPIAPKVESAPLVNTAPDQSTLPRPIPPTVPPHIQRPPMPSPSLSNDQSRTGPGSPTSSIDFSRPFYLTELIETPGRPGHIVVNVPIPPSGAGPRPPPGPLIGLDGETFIGPPPLKPTSTFAVIIHRALLFLPRGRGTLGEVCNWVAGEWEWFRLNIDAGWQNSIRHNLSLNKAFLKVPRIPEDDPESKGSVWIIDPEEGPLFEEKQRKDAQKSVGKEKNAEARRDRERVRVEERARKQRENAIADAQNHPHPHPIHSHVPSHTASHPQSVSHPQPHPIHRPSAPQRAMAPIPPPRPQPAPRPPPPAPPATSANAKGVLQPKTKIIVSVVPLTAAHRAKSVINTTDASGATLPFACDGTTLFLDEPTFSHLTSDILDKLTLLGAAGAVDVLSAWVINKNKSAAARLAANKGTTTSTSTANTTKPAVAPAPRPAVNGISPKPPAPTLQPPRSTPSLPAKSPTPTPSTLAPASTTTTKPTTTSSKPSSTSLASLTKVIGMIAEVANAKGDVNTVGPNASALLRYIRVVGVEIDLKVAEKIWQTGVVPVLPPKKGAMVAGNAGAGSGGTSVGAATTATGVGGTGTVTKGVTPSGAPAVNGITSNGVGAAGTTKPPVPTATPNPIITPTPVTTTKAPPSQPPQPPAAAVISATSTTAALPPVIANGTTGIKRKIEGEGEGEVKKAKVESAVSV